MIHRVRFLLCRAIVLLAMLPLSQVSVAAALEEVTVLTPAPPTLPAFSPWLLAEARGYYRDVGLKVNLVAANGGAVQVAKLVGAGTALAGSSVADAPIIVRANGIPIKSVAVLGGHSLMQVAVAANNDAIKGPADLRGKTVTVGSYTDSIYYSFLGMLGRYGLTKRDVTIQAAGPTGVWQLFAEGKADAMVGTPDWILAARNAGAKIKVFYGEEYFPSLPQAIVVSDKAIAQQPELVRKLVTATLKGFKYVMENPEAAAKEFVRIVPAYAGKEAYVKELIKEYATQVYPGQQVLGKMDTGRLQSIKDFYLKEGLVRTAGPLSDYYTDEFITSKH